MTASFCAVARISSTIWSGRKSSLNETAIYFSCVCSLSRCASARIKSVFETVQCRIVQVRFDIMQRDRSFKLPRRIGHVEIIEPVPDEVLADFAEARRLEDSERIRLE